MVVRGLLVGDGDGLLKIVGKKVFGGRVIILLAGSECCFKVLLVEGELKDCQETEEEEQGNSEVGDGELLSPITVTEVEVFPVDIGGLDGLCDSQVHLITVLVDPLERLVDANSEDSFPEVQVGLVDDFILIDFLVETDKGNTSEVLVGLARGFNLSVDVIDILASLSCSLGVPGLEGRLELGVELGFGSLVVREVRQVIGQVDELSDWSNYVTLLLLIGEIV